MPAFGQAEESPETCSDAQDAPGETQDLSDELHEAMRKPIEPAVTAENLNQAAKKQSNGIYDDAKANPAKPKPKKQAKKVKAKKELLQQLLDLLLEDE